MEGSGGGEKKSSEDGIGVPHIILEEINKSDLDEIHKHPKLPPLAEVLDGMGLGPKGPPVPPPALFSVVPYPAYRKAPLGSEFSHYIFVTTNENDPNLQPDEKSLKDAAAAAAVSMTEAGGGDGGGVGSGDKSPDGAPSKTKAKGNRAGVAGGGGASTRTISEASSKAETRKQSLSTEKKTTGN